VSLNANRIAGYAGLRASAGQTLVLFITPLVIAAALLTPRQPLGPARRRWTGRVRASGYARRWLARRSRWW
jgi:hypothetical protein